jgi:hypothetical protein
MKTTPLSRKLALSTAMTLGLLLSAGFVPLTNADNSPSGKGPNLAVSQEANPKTPPAKETKSIKLAKGAGKTSKFVGQVKGTRTKTSLGKTLKTAGKSAKSTTLSKTSGKRNPAKITKADLKPHVAKPEAGKQAPFQPIN